MGLKHFHGHGVEQDRQEAMKWFKKAADQVKSLNKHLNFTNLAKGYFDIYLENSLKHFFMLSLMVLAALETDFYCSRT